MPGHIANSATKGFWILWSPTGRQWIACRSCIGFVCFHLYR